MSLVSLFKEKGIERVLGDGIKNKNYEFEVRYTEMITQSMMEHIVALLTFSPEEGGLELPYEGHTVLNVVNDMDDVRMSLMGKDAIKLYWVERRAPDPDWIRKKRLKNMDLSDYNLRLSLSEETELSKTSSEVQSNLKKLKNTEVIKTYRLKNITRIKWGSFWFDCSVIKQATGKTFKGSKVIEMPPQYEIEIEYNKEEKDLKKAYAELIERVEFLIKNLQQSIYVISQSEKDKIMTTYRDLIGFRGKNTGKNTGKNNSNSRQEFIAANPTTLKLETLAKEELGRYAISYKIDGERHLIYITNGKLYAFPITLELKNTGITIPVEYNNTVLEAELVNDIFWVYNCIFYKNRDVRSLNLIGDESRLNLMRDVISKVKKESVYELREIIFKAGPVYGVCRDFWSRRADQLFEVDGLIFTPAYEAYPKTLGTWKKLYKWKPPKYNTIDFLVKTEKDINNKDKIYPLVIPSKEAGFPAVVRQYKVLNLFVGDTLMMKNGKKKIVPVIFNPNSEDTGGGEIPEIARAKILLNEKGQMLTDSNELIMDDSIVEMSYNREKREWNPLKNRDDKTKRYKEGAPVYGNASFVAYDNWDSIQNPITEDMITTGDLAGAKIDIKSPKDISSICAPVSNTDDSLMDYEKYLNRCIKYLLENYVFKSSASGGEFRLMDMTWGRGFMMPYWSKFKQVLSVVEDKMCAEYEQRLVKESMSESSTSKESKVNIIWGNPAKVMYPDFKIAESERGKKLLKEIVPASNSFDIVSTFWGLEEVIVDDKSFKRFLLNISENLKPNGRWIGVSLDGQAVFDMLKGEKSVAGNGWSIEKEYKIRDWDGHKKSYGKAYLLNLGEEITYQQYLVPVEYVSKTAKEYGLELERMESISKIETGLEINREDEKFVFGHVYFEFKKTGTVSPKNRKKLLS